MPIAQLNIAHMLAPMDDPIMQGFVDNLERVNALADEAPGFIWRMQGDYANAEADAVFADPNIIVNMSVWADIDSLHDYVYQSYHKEMIRRKKEWFAKIGERYMVLWRVEEGHIPSPKEAKARLSHLQEHGPSPFAFTFRDRY